MDGTNKAPPLRRSTDGKKTDGEKKRKAPDTTLGSDPTKTKKQKKDPHAAEGCRRSSRRQETVPDPEREIGLYYRHKNIFLGKGRCIYR